MACTGAGHACFGCLVTAPITWGLVTVSLARVPRDRLTGPGDTTRPPLDHQTEGRASGAQKAQKKKRSRFIDDVAEASDEEEDEDDDDDVEDLIDDEDVVDEEEAAEEEGEQDHREIEARMRLQEAGLGQVRVMESILAPWCPHWCIQAQAGRV